MRIVQIIDSLEVGGAERMAINYANALGKKISFSGLVATRKEGELKNKIEDKVDYFFLNRTKTLDLKAVFKLKAYCKKHKIEFLQPHSSSYFLAVLVKLIYPRIQIIWHDHNGLSEFIHSQKCFSLKIASFFFRGIIVVNYQLKNWANKELNCNEVIYLPNFTNHESKVETNDQLKGQEGKKIICLANLREQKNHFLLLRVAEKLKVSHPNWSFHLVGKNFQDDYSKELEALINSKKLEQNVYIYGTKNNSPSLINESEIAILTSKSEGLPVALLEYGLNKKAVVVTPVGEIPMIIKDGVNGYIAPSDNDELFYKSLIALIENPNVRKQFGEALYQTIAKNNSEDAVIIEYLNWIKNI